MFERIRAANLKVNHKNVFFEKKSKIPRTYSVSTGDCHGSRKNFSGCHLAASENKEQVQSFLGFCSYYRKFVSGFSLIAKPLYNLTEEKRKFEWSSKCEKAFDHLKEVLFSSPILSFPVGPERFILDTDASNHGIGAVLSQVQNGTEKVIAYFSRVFSKTEKNYCITRRELLAVVDAVKSFHHYLYGRNFIVRTDHIALRWLLSFKNLEEQLAR